MKRISVDMDGVIANVYSQFIQMHAAEFGEVLTSGAIDGKPESAAFLNAMKYVTSPGFFLNAPVIENSQAVMQKLNERCICSFGRHGISGKFSREKIMVNHPLPFYYLATNCFLRIERNNQSRHND